MRGGVGSSEPLPLGVYAYLAGLDIYRFEQSQKLTPTWRGWTYRFERSQKLTPTWGGWTYGFELERLAAKLIWCSLSRSKLNPEGERFIHY